MHSYIPVQQRFAQALIKWDSLGDCIMTIIARFKIELILQVAFRFCKTC